MNIKALTYRLLGYKTVDELFDEVNKGKTVSGKAMENARKLSKALIPTGLIYPEGGEVFEAVQDIKISYLTHFMAPHTDGDKAKILKGERVIISKPNQDKPLGYYSKTGVVRNPSDSALILRVITCILFLLVVLILTSCKQNEDIKNRISYRDTAVKLYLERNEYLKKNNFEFYERDSNSFDYKLLKGYYYNDSFFLKGVIKQLKDSYFSTQYLDSFWKANIPVVKNIKSEEAYQFQYSETFCNDVYVITISKDSSIIKLNSIIYRPTKIVDEKLAEAEIIENKNKNLKLSDWETLTDTLDYADFWNLKPANYDIVLDPSNLTIIGIKDNPYVVGEQRTTNSVSRTIFKRRAIYKAFLVAQRLAEIEKVCGD